ncbi:N-acetylmuramoyl-L-alanine amidase [Clostridium lundense]|uniref:N-acetylmuramoyl-L-alanine amidase n=1 Tax=Clostridium lundense TaxID=319475 RepID=UPI00048438F7|nr:N-acetylmuramoyl-L-alanine amidase [Clostridium lundense]
MLQIIRQISRYNYSNGNDIKYIVIHDTGNYKDTAQNNSDYFCGGDRKSSAHYFVDENSIIQVVEDFNASWHCGDGKMRYGIGNYNSIGIEMCNSGGYISEKTINNTVDLVKYLMKKYNVSIENVVRHYDASRKICPYNMSANNWAKWNEFKSKLVGNNSSISSQRLLKLTSPLMYGEDIKELQKDLVAIGFKLSVDGYYGAATINAVKKFQSLHAWLDVDGMVGEKTKKEIKDAVAKTLKEDTNNKIYKIQVGAFKNKNNADALLKDLKNIGIEGFVKEE